MLKAMVSDEMEPQIMSPRVTPLEGVSTYALRGIRVCGVENPPGFGIDERRLNALSLQIIGAAFEVSNVLDTVHFAQCLNYLKITGLKLCLLLNFCKPKVEIKRIVNGI